MSNNKKYSRLIIKRTDVSGVFPTIPSSDDHTDGSWSDSDIYKGEFFINLTDDKAWIRTNDGIRSILLVGDDIPGGGGTSGSSGTSGVDGTDGTSGVDGVDGTDGTSGVDGNDGVDGTDGTSGISGTDGTSGVDGNDGVDGTSGVDGNDGVDGTSGVGVPSGGTIGQVLAKIDNTDYNTYWVEQSGVTSTAYVTPENFGAVGDGVADDSVEFQEFLDYLGTNNVSGRLISNKTYFIDESIYVRNNPVILEGDGTSTIEMGSIDVFYVRESINFKGIKFTGGNDSYGLRIDNQNAPNGMDVIVDSCTFFDKQRGIDMFSYEAAFSMSSLSVTNCIFDNVGTGIVCYAIVDGKFYAGHNVFKNYVRSVGKPEMYNILHRYGNGGTIEDNESYGHSITDAAAVGKSYFCEIYSDDVNIIGNYLHDTSLVAGTDDGFTGIYMNGNNLNASDNIIVNFQKGVTSSIMFKRGLTEKYSYANNNIIINDDATNPILWRVIYGDGALSVSNNYIYTQWDNTSEVADIGFALSYGEEGSGNNTAIIDGNFCISDRKIINASGPQAGVTTISSLQITNNNFEIKNSAGVAIDDNTVIKETLGGQAIDSTIVEGNIFRIEGNKVAYYNTDGEKDSFRFNGNDVFIDNSGDTVYNNSRIIVNFNGALSKYAELNGNRIDTIGIGSVCLLGAEKVMIADNNITLDYQYSTYSGYGILELFPATTAAGADYYTFKGNHVELAATAESTGTTNEYIIRNALAKEAFLIKDNIFINNNTTAIDIRGCYALTVKDFKSVNNRWENINYIYGDAFGSGNKALFDGDYVKGGDKYMNMTASLGSITMKNLHVETTSDSVWFNATAIEKVLVEDCYIHSSGTYGLYSLNNKGVDDLTVRNSSVGGTTAGIYLFGPSDIVKISDTTITGSSGLYIRKDITDLYLDRITTTKVRVGSGYIVTNLYGLNAGEDLVWTVEGTITNTWGIKQEDTDVDIYNKMGSIITKVNPEYYGAVGDGVADDYSALVSFFNYIQANNVRGYLSPNKVYYTSNELAVLLSGDLKIDGNGSTIVRDYGDSYSDFDSIIDITNNQNTVTADVVADVDANVNMLKLDSTSGMSAGMGIKITSTEVYANDGGDKLKGIMSVIRKVEDSEYIFIDDPTPFSIDAVNITQIRAFQPYNVDLRNFNVTFKGDDSGFTYKISHLLLRDVFNPIIKNLSFVESNYQVLRLEKVYGAIVDNIYIPWKTDSYSVYGITSDLLVNSIIRNAKVYTASHGVALGTQPSYNVTFKDSFFSSGEPSGASYWSFDTHSCHSVFVDNCVMYGVAFGFGNITITNSKLNGRLGVDDVVYYRSATGENLNLVIDNCEVKANPGGVTVSNNNSIREGDQITFKNCEFSELIDLIKMPQIVYTNNRVNSSLIGQANMYDSDEDLTPIGSYYDGVTSVSDLGAVRMDYDNIIGLTGLSFIARVKNDLTYDGLQGICGVQSGDGLQFQIQNSANRIQVNIREEVAGNIQYNIDDKYTWDDQWHDVGFSLDSSGFRLYIDGYLIHNEEFTFTSIYYTSSREMVVGAFNDFPGSENHWRGGFERFQWFEYPLNVHEIVKYGKAPEKAISEATYILNNNRTNLTWYDDTANEHVGNVQSGFRLTSYVTVEIGQLIGYVTPEQFGAVGDGVTDDVIPFTNMFAYADGVDTHIMFGKEKTYYLSDGLPLFTLTNNIEVDGNNSTLLFKDEDMDADVECMSFIGYGTSFTVSGTIMTEGSYSFDVVSAAGMENGMGIMIRTDEVWNVGSAIHYKGWNTIIDRIDGNTIWVTDQIPYDVTVANITQQKAYNVYKLKVHNIKFDFIDTVDWSILGYGYEALVWYQTFDTHIYDCEFKSTYVSIYPNNTYNDVIERCIVNRQTSNMSVYGASPYGQNNSVWRDCKFYCVGNAIAHSGNPSNNVLWENCDAYSGREDSSEAAFDAHSGQRIRSVNCNFRGINVAKGIYEFYHCNFISQIYGPNIVDLRAGGTEGETYITIDSCNINIGGNINPGIFKLITDVGGDISNQFTIKNCVVHSDIDYILIDTGGGGATKNRDILIEGNQFLGGTVIPFRFVGEASADRGVFTMKDNVFDDMTLSEGDGEFPYNSFRKFIFTGNKPSNIVSQVETAIIAGTIDPDGAGDIDVTVTGALVAGSPLTIQVAVASGDTASDVAGKVRTSLNIAAITDNYTVSGTNTNVVLRANDIASEDTTFNIAYDNGTASGLLSSLTSTGIAPGRLTLYMEAMDDVEVIIEDNDFSGIAVHLVDNTGSMTVRNNRFYGTETNIWHTNRYQNRFENNENTIFEGNIAGGLAVLDVSNELKNNDYEVYEAYNLYGATSGIKVPYDITDGNFQHSAIIRFKMDVGATTNVSALISSDNSVAFWIRLYPATHEVSFRIQTDDSYEGTSSFVPEAIWDGNWHTIGYVVDSDAGYVRIYCDGRIWWYMPLVGTAFGSSSWDLQIGARASAEVLEGSTSDFAFFDKKLTDEEMVKFSDDFALAKNDAFILLGERRETMWFDETGNGYNTEIPPADDITLLNHEKKLIITPEYFGAVGDGVTDDATATQSWINYLGTYGDVGHTSSNKNYYIGSTVSITNPVTFTGDGTSTFSGTYGFRFRSDINISNVIFDMDDYIVTEGAIVLDEPNANTGITIEVTGCKFINNTTTRYGLDVRYYEADFASYNGVANVIFERNTVENCNNGVRVAVKTTGLARVTKNIFKDYIEPSVGSTNPHAIYIGITEDLSNMIESILIDGNVFSGYEISNTGNTGGFGAFLRGTEIIVTNNYFRDSDCDVDLSTSNHYLSGIYCQGDNTVIESNIFENWMEGDSQGHAINLKAYVRSGYTSHHQVKNNQFIYDRLNTNESGDIIYGDGNIRIENNYFWDTSTLSGNTEGVISCKFRTGDVYGGEYEYNYVKDNWITTNRKAIIFTQGGKSMVIDGNTLISYSSETSNSADYLIHGITTADMVQITNNRIDCHNGMSPMWLAGYLSEYAKVIDISENYVDMIIDTGVTTPTNRYVINGLSKPQKYSFRNNNFNLKNYYQFSPNLYGDVIEFDNNVFDVDIDRADVAGTTVDFMNIYSNDASDGDFRFTNNDLNFSNVIITATDYTGISLNAAHKDILIENNRFTDASSGEVNIMVETGTAENYISRNNTFNGPYHAYRGFGSVDRFIIENDIADDVVIFAYTLGDITDFHIKGTNISATTNGYKIRGAVTNLHVDDAVISATNDFEIHSEGTVTNVYGLNSGEDYSWNIIGTLTNKWGIRQEEDDFDLKNKITGTLQIGDYTLPSDSGQTGYILISDGSGGVYWSGTSAASVNLSSSTPLTLPDKTNSTPLTLPDKTNSTGKTLKVDNSGSLVWDDDLYMVGGYFSPLTGRLVLERQDGHFDIELSGNTDQPYYLDNRYAEKYIDSEPENFESSGTKSSMLLGESVVTGDVLYQNYDGKLYKADSINSLTMPGFAIAIESGVSGEYKNVLLYGFITNSSWSLTVSGEVYVSTAAGITQTEPSSPGNLSQIIGIATGPNRILFNPSYVTIEK